MSIPRRLRAQRTLSCSPAAVQDYPNATQRRSDDVTCERWGDNDDGITEGNTVWLRELLSIMITVFRVGCIVWLMPFPTHSLTTYVQQQSRVSHFAPPPSRTDLLRAHWGPTQRVPATFHCNATATNMAWGKRPTAVTSVFIAT